MFTSVTWVFRLSATRSIETADPHLSEWESKVQWEGKAKFDFQSGSAGIIEGADSMVNCNTACRAVSLESSICRSRTRFRYNFLHFAAKIEQTHRI